MLILLTEQAHVLHEGFHVMLKCAMLSCVCAPEISLYIVCSGCLHQIFSLCSYKCLLSGLWYHCWHCFGSPCHPHHGTVLYLGLLLLLLCLAPTEGYLQEEEGRCQVHYQRPFPGSSSSALESDEPKVYTTSVTTH